ncbi:response regulator transcription factor [Burkholderia sp. SIMBA_043]|uniref:response regulator transcription factor n=1 Tax=Burkholderia TaxID=32008 RepID=UPI0005D7F80A|nr:MULTISPECIES: response regulator transcription factor [Burkholderia cepacia complex]AJY05043.1 bacterial regulatory s, luxR family protein [Burkholderia vietnamiensis LMG 10929]AVR17574.1 DNA-binding response regulator [Burkholderia vietnamiensis]UBI27171.1 response regulator transcription factor [Burkholderia vietnamiensis]
MNYFSIRVAITDDHPSVLIGLQNILKNAGQIDLIGACQSPVDLIEMLQRTPCDVVICEYTMYTDKYCGGPWLFEYLQREYPNVGIVVLTTLKNAAVIHTLLSRKNLSVVSKADAIGHVITAIHAAFAGGTYNSPTIRSIAESIYTSRLNTIADLSPKEAEVMSLFVAGNTVTEISFLLKRSKQTVSSHKRSAMRKLGVSNDIEFISFILNGLATHNPNEQLNFRSAGDVEVNAP